MIQRILLIMLAIFALPGQAFAASCDATNTYAFNFSSQAAATLAYGSTYSYTATSGGGATQGFTVNIAQIGMTSTVVASTQMPNISTMITGSTATARDLVVGGVFGGRTVALGTDRTASVTFTFTVPIREFTLLAHDIDYSNNQYRDWVKVSGANGASVYTPVLTTPGGSTVTIGPSASPSLVAGQAAGNATAANNSDQGNLTATFAQPVTTITFSYGNYPLGTGETTTGQQAIGFAGFTYCPMPALAAVKTSAPTTGTYGAFNYPGNDVIYTLTLNNTGGSSIDLAADPLNLTDVLPANVTFRNLAFDGATTLPVKVISAAGTTIGASNITYKLTTGSTYTYTPVAGYDPLVGGIRIAPSGTLAANSTLTVQFKVQIK